MRPSPRFAEILTYAANAAAKARRATAHGGISYQYVYKVDEVDYHFKLVADLTDVDVVVTMTEVYEGEEPVVRTLKALYEADHVIYVRNRVSAGLLRLQVR